MNLEGFPGDDRRLESTAHAAEAGRVGAAEGVQQGPTGESVGTQAVQYRFVEAGRRGEGRVGVQRVPVAVEPLEQGLVRPGRVGDHVVGVAVGEMPFGGWAPVTTPPPLTTDEQT